MAKSLDGFLNNLQDWELSLEDKDKKKLKSQASHGENPVSSSRKIALASDDITSSGRTSSRDYSSKIAGKYDCETRYGSTTHIPSTFTSEENSPDAVSEKELGNEYFKQKKFKEAVDCYSRSIALSPTAVAYANRAMAFLKIRKFQEAEDDCTEALNLDDRYIKAYSRRATARKQLGKLKESIEDSEFALRMEPGNQEIVKQIAETKSLYKKENLEKMSGLQRSPVDRAAVSRVSEIIGTSATSQKERDNQFPVKTSVPVGEIQSKKVEVLNRNRIQKAHHKQLGPSMQQLASRAASQALADAARSITPPTSAYRFEVSWRALSSDPSLQAHLLKAVEPNALPQIFKNSLSAPILVGIVKCVASFFTEEMDLAIKYLDNLTKVARFDMIMMCLSYTDRTDILNLWNEVFFGQSIQSEYTEILDKLRPRYCSR